MACFPPRRGNAWTFYASITHTSQVNNTYYYWGSLTSHSLSSTYVLLLIHLRYLVSTTWVCRSLSCHWFSEKYTLQHNDCSKKKNKKPYFFPCIQMGKIQATSGRWKKQISDSSKSLDSSRDNRSLPTHIPSSPDVDLIRMLSPCIHLVSRFVCCMMKPRTDKVVKLFECSEVTRIMHKADSSVWIVLHNVLIIIIRSFKHPPSCTTSPGKYIPG